MPYFGNEFVVGNYHPQHPSLKASMYKIMRKGASDYAQAIGRELAEGPTVYLPENYYGPVELWPLVYVEEKEDALPG
jgi:hypothetical protein